MSCGDCRGTNEDFQVRTCAPARDMFGGHSPLEHTHVAILATAFRLSPLGFLDRLPLETQDTFLCLVRRLVLVRLSPLQPRDQTRPMCSDAPQSGPERSRRTTADYCLHTCASHLAIGGGRYQRFYDSSSPRTLSLCSVREPWTLISQTSYF